ncbi:MAG: S8 family peptidase, partial [Stackebrandtia sp.]
DRTFRRVATLGLSLAAAGAVALVSPTIAEGTVLGAGAPNAIPGSYLVVFKDGVHTTDITAKYGGQVKSVWKDALHGYSATMSERQAKRLAADPAVAYVEQDQTFSLLTDQVNPPSWGLDRVDQRTLPLNRVYTYTPTGAGVTVYIIDTGIRTTHTTFGGRAVWGTNTTGDGNNTDCNGHGTHVAGTVGGSTYGVAKSSLLRAVRVLNCSGSGTNSGVIAGVDWVRANHIKPAVANMSLGGGASSAVDTAVNNAINAGVTFVVAAGNSNANACNYSPARTASALTIGASTSTDARSSFSNYGSCVDLFAPGVSIRSTLPASDTATGLKSGTSMATPHVAGVAAQFLQTAPVATPK